MTDTRGPEAWNTDAGRWLTEHADDIQWDRIPLPAGVPKGPFQDGSYIATDPRASTFWPVAYDGKTADELLNRPW
jgi:hypothetical protein